MNQTTIYSIWLMAGFINLIAGVGLVGGVGAALITTGCGLITAAIMGLHKHDQEPS